MRFTRVTSAMSWRRSVALVAFGLSLPAAAIPPDQRTIYDEWIRDSQARTAAAERDKRLWKAPETPTYTGGGIQARLEREAREAWQAGERRMRERSEARETAQRARDAEMQALTLLYDAARAGDADSLMTVAKRNESMASWHWGLEEYQRVYGPRRREALTRMVELMRKHEAESDSFGSVLSLTSCLTQLALLGDAKAAGELAEIKLRAADFYEAANYFAQAGAGGDGMAQKQAIRLVAEDRLDAVSTDPEVFYGWARTWAAKGDVASQWIYGNALAVGGDLAKNTEQALVVLRQAAAQLPEKLTDAEKGFRVRAGTLAGAILLEGRGVKADPEAGVALLENAAQAGSADAMFTLGRAYVQGTGVARDSTEAIKWLTSAVTETKDARATELLAEVYLMENSVVFDEAKGVDWLSKASKRRPQAMLDYGRLLATGERGVARDEEEALALFTRALQHYPNDPAVLAFIGNAYLGGNYGVKQKPAEGVRYLKRAVGRGSREAADRLVVVYRDGVEGIAPDATEAARWAEKSGS